MAFTPLNNSDLEVSKPIRKSILTTTKDNFDDHESRISALSASANKIVMFDEFYNFADFDLGKITASEMSVSDFQAINGTDWVLCDGSSVSSSMWSALTGNNNLPDLRGEFLRGLDNGRGVDSGRTLGSFQADEFESHNHGGGNHTHSQDGAVGTGSGGWDDFQSDSNTEIGSENTGASGTIIDTEGGNETRPRNVAVNYFMKIDHTITLNIKAREDQTIVAVKGYVIDQFGLPTSGTLEFDIKKGTDRTALSSIFTLLPSLDYGSGVADGDSTDSGSFASGGADVTQGDWLRLDVTSFMVGQTGLYIQVFSEPA